MCRSVLRMISCLNFSPWPEEALEFTTLWCRFISANCKEWKFQLRDFPQPWLDIGELHLWGKLVGAEQEATKRGNLRVACSYFISRVYFV